jgi:cell wall-associated NlpC family hydrolase
MDEQLLNALVEAQEPLADTRFNVCRLEAVPGQDGYRLEGAVLDKATLAAVVDHLHKRLPGVRWDTDAVQVLRAARPRQMVVTTNLTGLQRDPSWLGEQQSQLLNGATVEILEEGERWSFVRLEDGYLGWAYSGYLGPTDGLIEPTHLIAAPVTLLRQEPQERAPLAGRVFAGTRVTAATTNGWAEIRLAGGLRGFAPAAELIPLTTDEPAATRRARLIANTQPYIGVPYLWGGVTAHGIDCSGFAQLMHKLVGVAIPRDADQQCSAGRPVEPPFAAGDLFFFGGPGGHRAVSHVGISLGPDYDAEGWQMIHSGRSRNGVYIDNVQAVDSLRESFLGARRFLL